MFSLIQLPNLRWMPKTLTPHGTSTQLATDTTQEKVRFNMSVREDIRDVIIELLSQCHIPHYRTPYDGDLYDLCIQECKLKGYPIDKAHGKASILKYIPCGVMNSCTGYAHLKNRSTLVFIAIYTAFLLWVDDTYTEHVKGVDTFHERFVTGQQQPNEALDGLARLLRETNLHYHGIQAHVILTSTLNFITSMLLDFETQGMAVSPHAKSYTTFLRVMTGISEAYAMFTFPPEVPMKYYVHAIPELCLVISYFNDVLSFYKEELVGESGNYISTEANQRGENKIPVLRALAHDVSICVSRVANILEGSGEAEAAFQSFMGGYVSFHISLDSRYHLDDLFPSQ
ncbi:terpenoid synthase [Phlegmacium glaucopus]|nr:terpenoid synthase [Phlegmacium glaucopus]